MRAPAFTLRDIGLIAIICLTWGGNFLTSAAALRELPPLMFSALRMTLLGVVLLPFTHWPPRAQWPLLAAVVLCNVVLHFGLSFWSLKLAGDLASPAIIMQSYVPMAVLFAWLIRGERFAWRSGLAILVSFAGILVLGFDPIVLDNPQSMVLMLVSALFLAIGTVLIRGHQRARNSVRPERSGHRTYRIVAHHQVVDDRDARGIGRPGPRLWIGGAMVLGGVLAVALRALAKQRAVTPAPSEI